MISKTICADLVEIARLLQGRWNRRFHVDGWRARHGRGQPSRHLFQLRTGKL